MTRTMLIASVAGLAIVTPAAGASAAGFDQKPDRAERQHCHRLAQWHFRREDQSCLDP